MRTIAIFGRGPGWDPSRDVYGQCSAVEHLASMRALQGRGVLLMGGPFTDESELAGVAVLETETIDEACELMANDPAVRAGIVSVRVHPHHPILDWRPAGREHA